MDEEDFDESKLFATFDAVEDSNKNALSSKPPRKKSIDATQLDLLKQENKQLKKVLRRIVSASSCQDHDESPVASVVYFDRRLSRGNPANIEELIKHFAKNREERNREERNSEDDKYKLPNGELSPVQRSSFCDTFALALGRCPEVSGQEDSERLEYDIMGIPSGSVQYFNSFCLDSFGSSVVDFSTMERYYYEQVYFNILPNEGQGKVKRPKSTCFNCDGDHKLQDCTKPRNLARISAKRQEFMANFSSPFVQEARYHADKEKQNKFRHLVPGKVTEKLREALGLGVNDLPPFMYRMRMLGYPPGWLPSNHDSGIVIHGKEGQADKVNCEGKILDPDKFVQFPGFNVAVPGGMKDLSNEVRLPRMEARHQLQLHPTAVTTSSSRKHRLSSETVDENHDDKRRRRSRTDMDIDDSDNNGVIIDNKITIMSTPTSGTHSPSLPHNFLHHASTPIIIDLEDGEIPDSPDTQRNNENSKRCVETLKDPKVKPSWWLKDPLVFSGVKGDHELVPPPFPLRPLPLHKISQILPGEMNHISFEDRNWLDPIFGNLQIRTGRYDRLKTILASRESKKK